MLQEQDRLKLDSIVQKMIANKESDDNIKLVVNDFKQRYGGTVSPIQVAPEKKGFFNPNQSSETFMGGLGKLVENVSIGTAKGVLNTVEGLAKFGDKVAASTVGKITGTQAVNPLEQVIGKEKTTEITTPEGIGQNIGFGFEKIVEFLAPSSALNKVKTAATAGIKGTGLLSKGARLATESGIEAGAVGAQTALQQGEVNDDVKTAAIVAALFPIIGAGIKGAGMLTEKAGQKIQQSVIKPGVNDVRDGFKIDNIKKYNLGGSLDQTLEKTNIKMNQLGEELKKKLGEATVPVNLNKVFTETIDSLGGNKLANFGDNAGIQRVISNLKQEITDVAGPNGLVDLLEANMVKRGAGNKGSWVFGSPDPDARAVEKVYNSFYNKLKVAIEQAAEKSGITGLKEVNKQLSELIPINNAVLRRIPIAERGNAISLTDSLGLFASVFDPKALATLGATRLSKSGRFGNLLVKAADIIKNPSNPVGRRIIGN